MEKLKVGIIGATGMVGQRFIMLLSEHPYFEIKALVAGPRSAGQKYSDAVKGRWKMKAECPEFIKEMTVISSDDIETVKGLCDFVFCAVSLSKDETRALEERYAKAEIPVVSNNSAHRWTPDVPMVIPEVNDSHLEVIAAQRKRLGTKRGFIAVKPNCSIQSYVGALTPLMKYGIKEVVATTYQAISGAGKTFNEWPEMIDNLIPFIGGEEDLRSYQQGKEVLLDEAVTGCFERTVLGYQAGDGVLSRMTDDDETLGEWSFTVEGYAAKQGTRRITNPLFSPTASVCDVIDIAPSAQLLSVGDRDTVVEETNIAPRIVLYEGLVPLPDAERWDSASSTESYPLAYFFNEHKSESLAFEPRARSEGLHCYHLTELREDAERQLLRCKLHLTPLEYAELFATGDALPRLCARFRLEVDGNSSLFRLHSIERYDADSHIADCVFRRTLSD